MMLTFMTEAAEKKRGFGTNEYVRQIMEDYSADLIRLSYTYVRNVNDAEDIAQDVMVALMKREKPFESSEHEKAWLFRITINKSKNFLKSGWIKRTVSLDDDENHSELPDESAEKTEANEVMEAVLSLPEKYRTPIHLFYYNGYSINEIAAVLNKKPATIGTLLARGRVLLKNMMIGGFDDEQID